MMKKTILLLLLAMAAPLFAQGENRLANLGTLDKDSLKVKVGTYFERQDYDSSRGDTINGLDDWFWWTFYIQAGVETKSFQGFNLGFEVLAHAKVYNSSENRYDVDIEPTARESLTQLYAQYKQGNIHAKLGRIDGMGAHLDDNRYEGIMGKFKTEHVTFLAGAITAYAELDYDDAEEWTRVTRLNNGEAGDAVLVAEATITAVDKMLKINPYIWVLDDYASVFGADTKLTVKTDGITFGGLLEGHHVDAKEGNDDGINYRIAGFAELKVANGKIYTEIGNTEIMDDGLIQPNGFKDYLYVVDQSQWVYQADASSYYIMVKYSTELANRKCWASAIYLDSEYAGDNEVEDIELQIGCQVTKQLNVNLRYFNIEHSTRDFCYDRWEGRIEYKF